MTTLAHLSFQRVGFRSVPSVPTNHERIQAYRALAPVELGNAFFAERFRAHQYAAEAAPGTDYDNQLREGFALKYGEEA